MLHRVQALAAAVLALWLDAGGASATERVFSLDQCADQYVLALAPRADIAGLSYRAVEADSYLRNEAHGLPLRRASTESVLASRATTVVRYWGGDELMARRLAGRGLTVIKIDDAQDFEDVRANIRRVAAGLGRRDAGGALISRMDAELQEAKGAWRGARALYLTPGGFTAGTGTLVGAMMSSAGLRNAAPSPGFAPVSMEQIVADPPARFVLGFFDPASMQAQHWSIGRHGALRKLMAGRTLAALPAAVLACPAWFAADGARALAEAHRP